ncbi:hypothetical protein H2199_005856 [Coniosporium tulheliwenetii]|uniref:Uncharacterized protein n=1 Tax=Coniosporium tulheliwenetii TaxID=3383036 RepID=A0ACC2YYD4_9PEZI|nr:hypothetical protein H2199_005856 [Cladosporium sp. JES 115]
MSLSTYLPMMDTFEFGSIFSSQIGSGSCHSASFDVFDSLGSNFDKAPLPTPPSPSFNSLQDLNCNQLLKDPKRLPTDRPQSCFIVALNILPSLLANDPTKCTLSSTPSDEHSSSTIPTIDSVISNNKQIIEAISRMLPCPCSLDAHLATIISLIAFKVMAWYAAAARDVPPSSSSCSTSSSGGTSSEPLPSPSEQVLHIPTTVGKYDLAGADQSRMRAQLVLSELHRVQRLVELLSKRLEGVRSRTNAGSRPSSAGANGSDKMDEAMSPMSATIFVQLEADLRKRLRAVSRETMSVVRRG